VPERVGRVVIHNRTSNMKLVKTFAHLCHGDWTPGGWVPPDTIGPGQTGGMQSESGGVLTGAEGHAKYDVIRDADGRQGMIYVYWDNPWFGVTHPRFATNAVDVHPDCDFQVPPGQSDFYSIDTSLSFYVAPVRYGHTHGGADVTAPGDLAEAFALGPALGIVSLFALQGINKDPVWEYELRDGPAPFASTSSGLHVGGHLAQGFNFALLHDVPPPPNTQDSWRFCSKCHGMFFDGSPDKGHCPQTADLLGTGNHYARV
jgi:hypothetical protein